MGHYRVGDLPKSKKWRNIVSEIANTTDHPESIASLALHTLDAARDSFAHLESEPAVLDVMRFYIALIHASRTQDPRVSLAQKGYPDLGDNPTPLRIQQRLTEWVQAQGPVGEYQQLALMASADTVSRWIASQSSQDNLFQSRKEAYEVWSKSADGSKFCEFARLYFANLTERHLRYFLERESAAALGSLEGSARFKDMLSKHAYETAKITQSFAAGWYNKNASTEVPNKRSVRGFLSHSFDKLREELRREATNGH